MYKNNIAFDFDETLINLMDVFDSYFQAAYPKKRLPARSEITQYSVAPVYKLTEDQVWEIFRHAMDHIEAFGLQPGAKALLTDIYGYSKCPVKIVTRRPFDKATQTYQLAERLLPVPFELVITQNDQSKANFLHGIDHFVEDRRKEAIDLAKRGKRVFLVDRPWNKFPCAIPMIVRVRDLRHIHNYFFQGQRLYFKEIGFAANQLEEQAAKTIDQVLDMIDQETWTMKPGFEDAA